MARHGSVFEFGWGFPQKVNRGSQGRRSGWLILPGDLPTGGGGCRAFESVLLCSWCDKPRGHSLYEQAEVEHLMASFPPVDVFVAHNSPRHVHDRDDDVHFGFEAFVRYLERA